MPGYPSGSPGSLKRLAAWLKSRAAPLDGGHTVTVARAAGAANTMRITVTVVDADGKAVAAVHSLELWMSGVSTGIGLTAAAYSGTLTAVAGAILTTLTAKKHFKVVTNASGVFTGDLVDTGKPATEYAVVRKPMGGGVVLSAASGTAWG